MPGPVEVRQSAVAEFSAAGFAAAAITTIGTTTGSSPWGGSSGAPFRQAVVHLNRPYAVVAVATAPPPASPPSRDEPALARPRLGVPVFSAWVEERAPPDGD